MDTLFNNSQATPSEQIFEKPTVSAGSSVEQMIEQLISEGFSPDDSAEAVKLYIQSQQAAQHSINASAMKLRTDKERIEYMRQLRARVAPDIWIPPHLQQMYESDQRVVEAQEKFKQAMRARSASSGMLHSTQAAIDFFRKKP